MEVGGRKKEKEGQSERRKERIKELFFLLMIEMNDLKKSLQCL